MNLPDLSSILRAAIAYDGADPRRVHHLIKVYGFAQAIGGAEGLDERTRYTLEAAAILHDIGIHEAERRHGSSGGKWQELEGPPIARELLAPFELPEDMVERICFLIAHHHTYDQVDGIDYQILLEADFLVNAYEDGLPRTAIEHFCKKTAKTAAGLDLIRTLFLPPEE
ncbi:MAG: HD domain-containing protein [Butyricicoccaceae bacterium]